MNRRHLMAFTTCLVFFASCASDVRTTTENSASPPATTPAFFVARVTIKDPGKFGEYARRAGATMAPYGGAAVLRGKVAGALAGAADHQAVGIVRFPSQRALDAWYESEAYQAIVPLRDEAADVTIITYSMP